jgi:predicted O-linked N-acetylglucosamine transferase (SPINDLY family)
MDYRLTDRLSEPAGSEQYYSEKLLYLPDSTWCYAPPQDSPDLAPLPALKNGYLTFGSLNSIDKVDVQSIALWAKLLHRLPTARLLILAVPEARRYFIDQFTARGIDTARLEFLGKLSPLQYREVVRQIDISLDSYPVNGATTTCESLWQGVPSLSLHGGRHLSRNGLSILSAAGMPDFAAATEDELINTAALLADNLAVLQNIRLGMREHLANTPLLDQRQFVLNLESIYRSIWINWCNSPP